MAEVVTRSKLDIYDVKPRIDKKKNLAVTIQAKNLGN